MGKINVLSFDVANLIAAGEVVDRPASVIKELLENSIDAGATRINVEIQNGGVTFMRVADNGCGMDPEDLTTSVRRHATSKISEADDLDAIITLGFRGEALAAISSVSNMRIISKPKGATLGAELSSTPGEGTYLIERGCSEGTTVIVEDLFFNVPARRKFLKKDVTEAMAVSAVVEKIALSHPEIAFTFISDGNVKIETAGDSILKNAIYAVFGRDFASRLIEIESELDGIRISGFIGRSDNVKGNRNYQNFFINGRYVKSKTATAAIEQAFSSYIPPEKFPACVLNITINPARVDVNVHPAKMEVKFSNEKPVFEAIYYAVKTALDANVTRPVVFKADERAQKAQSVTGAFAPVNDGRAESLAKRQISYEMSLPKSEPKPAASAPRFERITAEEYLAKYVMGEPDTPENDTAPSASASAQSVPQSTPVQIARQDVPAQVEIIQSEAKPKEVSVPVQNVPVQSVPEQIKPAEDSISGASQPFDIFPNEYATLVKEYSKEVRTVEPEIPKNVAAPVKKAENTIDYRIIGEAFNAYVIVERGDVMLLVDKHAAHERIIFETLKEAMYKSEPVSQILMLPIEVMMTSDEVAVVSEYKSELEAIGFSFETMRNTVSVGAIPVGIESSAVNDMLYVIADRIKNGTGDVKLTRDIIFEKALYQASCKAAVKAGREYADGHVEWIIEKLMQYPDITVCPHGRPVAMELSHKFIDRQFGRT